MKMQANELMYLTLLLLLGSIQAVAAAPVLNIDPFEEPILIKKNEADLTGEQMSQYGIWNPQLRGTMRSSSGAVANIDGEIILVGEMVEGFRLVGVRERSVTFEKMGRKYVISMDEADGKDEAL